MSGQKPLSLIMARELATQLATPMFLIDAIGNLVYYNEAAEAIIGKPFHQLGEMPSIEWGKMLDLETRTGERLSLLDTPPSVAFNQQSPAHAMLAATAFDGSKVLIEVTSYPLLGRDRELQGVVTIFWHADGNPTGTNA